MKNKRLIKHSKEKFLPPRLTQTIGLELEDALLIGSNGPVTETTKIMGQEYVDYEATSPDYFEDNWY